MPAIRSSARMPQPAGSFSRFLAGDGFTISKNLNNRKPAAAMIRISLLPVAVAPRKVTACPASSSATTSPGSFLPVAAITDGAYRTHTNEPMTMSRIMATEFAVSAYSPGQRKQINANIAADGMEPHVPGAIGRNPRPKQDVSILFILLQSARFADNDNKLSGFDRKLSVKLVSAGNAIHSPVISACKHLRWYRPLFPVRTALLRIAWHFLRVFALALCQR